MKTTSMIFLFLCFSFSLFAQKEYKFIESETGKIYYEIQGTGEAVLLLSGGPGGAPESLQPIIDYVDQNNKAILLHQRGTGMSQNDKIDANSITLSQSICDIFGVLEKEQIGKTFIVGHSWGAMLALDFMVKYPSKVKGVILIGAPGLSLDFVQSMNGEMFNRLTSEEKDSVQLYFNQLKSSQDNSLRNTIESKINNILLAKQFFNSSLLSEILKYGAINKQVNQLMMNNLRSVNWNLEDELKTVEIPVIIINGQYDPIGKEHVLKLKNAMKSSTIYWIEDCGHYVWIEKPYELQQIIRKFLSEH